MSSLLYIDGRPGKIRVGSGSCPIPPRPGGTDRVSIIYREAHMSDTITDIPTLDEAPARRLVRADDGRWLGGVCAGLGRYFDINPLVYRIAFAALALAGGTGVLLYIAAWLVIPGERSQESVAVETLRRHRDRLGGRRHRHLLEPGRPGRDHRPGPTGRAGHRDERVAALLLIGRRLEMGTGAEQVYVEASLDLLGALRLEVGVA